MQNNGENKQTSKKKQFAAMAVAAKWLLMQGIKNHAGVQHPLVTNPN